MIKKTNLILWLIILTCFLLLITSSLTDSPTYDEPAHIFSGVSYPHFKDLRYNPEHPPLVKFLSGLSLKIFYPQLKINISQEEINHPLEFNPYVLGERLLADNDIQKLLIIARLPIILLTTISVYLIYKFSLLLTQNHQRSLLTTALYGFEVNLLASGKLVTTDLAFTFFWLATIYFWLKYLRQNKTKNLILSGIGLSLALLSKYSAVFIVPFLLISSLFLINQRFNLKKLLFSLLTISAIGLIGIWLFFLLFGPANFEWESLPEVQQALVQVKSPLLSQLIDKSPLPSFYRYGLKLINHHESVGQLQYLVGKISQYNWWWFYPLTFLLKTSIVVLILLAIALINFFRQKIKPQTSKFLLTNMGFYLLLTINSSLAFGMRILLPLIFFSCLIIGKHLPKIKLYQLYTTIIIFHLLLSLANFPFFLASANPLVILFGNKHQALADSNLDWGQDLKRVINWANNQKTEGMSIVYFSSIHHQLYDFNNLSLEQAIKNKQHVAVSASKMNFPASFINENNEAITLKKPYQFLKKYPVIAVVGSFKIYDTSQLK